MKRFLSILLATAMVFSIASCGSKTSDSKADGTGKTSKTKVALLLPGTINDNGWNATAYNGLKLIESELGAEIAYSEKVAQSDQEEVFRNYATNGYTVLIGHGYEFTDAAKRVASQFPDIKFLITSTDAIQEPNLGSTSTNPKQMGFLTGVVAALTTKTNKVGGVGGMEIPPIVFAMEGFEAGVKYINPDIAVTISMTGDFDDAVKAKESTNALINSGADVIVHDADQAGLGVLEACKEKNVLVISTITTQHELAPDVVLGGGISDVPKAMMLAVQKMIKGEFEAKFYDVGINDGVVYFVPNPKFESLYKEKLAEITEDIKSGKIDVEAEVAKLGK